MPHTQTDTAKRHCPVCHKNLRVTRAAFIVEEGELVYCSQMCRELAEERAKEATSGKKRHGRWIEHR